ncbi:hypothetical protein, partial [Bifidobacterium adolescentis]|uniref:hypothetical protein n=1 Tax=Bifidobacterium adolescentis TaxID=1680 RepID=UPI001CAA2534
PGFQSRFFVLANENRTQDAGHALLRQGRNPKVRKNSGVIAIDRPHCSSMFFFFLTIPTTAHIPSRNRRSLSGRRNAVMKYLCFI